MRAVIFGSTGGVGHAMCQQLVSEGHDVHAVSRKGAPLDGATPHAADITDETSLAALAATLKPLGPIDTVIVATGLLSDGDALQPEKTYRHLDMDQMARVFAVNTFGPALVGKHMLPLMHRKERAVFAALSARVGSISDNRMGGWHSYRAAKAALNMMIRNFAIEQGRRNADFIAVSLHPGTVDTGLSRPFQGNVPDKQLFTPDVSAQYLLSVVNGLTAADTGKAFDWAGETIPF